VSISFNRAKQLNGVFVKTYGPKTPFWRYYFRSALNTIGIRQPVEYYNRSKRLDFEYRALKLWKHYDLNVPSVAFKDKISLHLSIIKGRTLASKLSRSVDFKVITALFEDLNYRHQLAFEHNEPRLCHVDANLRNILYSDQKIFHVDFEMGREYESVELWARREVSKLLISLLNILPFKNREEVLTLFCQHYSIQEVINSLIQSKLGRIDNKRKRAPNTQNTLYNLALDLSRICQ